MEMKIWDDCTIAQKVERWTNVLRVLKALTPHQRRKHWDMSDFAYKTECGTVACAAGHCGLDRWFRKRGFTIEWYKNWNGELQAEVGDVDGFFGTTGCAEIFYNDRKRPVSKVIREVSAYIKRLKSA